MKGDRRRRRLDEELLTVVHDNLARKKRGRHPKGHAHMVSGLEVADTTGREFNGQILVGYQTMKSKNLFKDRQLSYAFDGGAPRWACLNKRRNADFAAISRWCATLGLFG